MKFNIDGFSRGKVELSVLLSIICKMVRTIALYELSTILGVDLEKSELSQTFATP
jgi:hypothetical protein